MNKCYTMILVLLFLVLTMSVVLAYHPGSHTGYSTSTQVAPPKDPGNAPTYIIVGIVLGIAGLIYWKVNYAQDM